MCLLVILHVDFFSFIYLFFESQKLVSLVISFKICSLYHPNLSKGEKSRKELICNDLKGKIEKVFVI
jgi:hypothetical protein